MTKEILFSVTAKDCRWDYFKGSGAGGQKKNKTSSAVRCTHKASGAVGKSEKGRSQRDNKELAFARMAKTKEFLAWHRIEVARRTGELQQIKEKIDAQLADPKITRIVYYDPEEESCN